MFSGALRRDFASTLRKSMGTSDSRINRGPAHPITAQSPVPRLYSSARNVHSAKLSEDWCTLPAARVCSFCNLGIWMLLLCVCVPSQREGRTPMMGIAHSRTTVGGISFTAAVCGVCVRFFLAFQTTSANGVTVATAAITITPPARPHWQAALVLGAPAHHAWHPGQKAR